MQIENHIVGIGGVFFKSKAPEKLTEWYKKILGFSTQIPFDNEDTAINFKWKTFSGEHHNTVWAPFSKKTTYFDPSPKEWMINYIVKDLEGLIRKLEMENIEIVEKIRKYP